MFLRLAMQSRIICTKGVSCIDYTLISLLVTSYRQLGALVQPIAPSVVITTVFRGQGLPGHTVWYR